VNRSDPAAIPYAKALIEIGRDEGLLDRIYDELTAIESLLREGGEQVREARLFFLSPSVDPEHKFQVIKSLFGDQVCRPVLGFLKILFQKKREPLFDNIMDRFVAFKDETENRVRVQVKSATVLPDEVLASLKERIVAATGKRVVLETSQDPKLLGGAVIRVGDRLVDGSLRERLRQLRKQLRSAGFVWAQEQE
jgi:F-type H+-transporting ATPase subunit delta